MMLIQGGDLIWTEAACELGGFLHASAFEYLHGVGQGDSTALSLLQGVVAVLAGFVISGDDLVGKQGEREGGMGGGGGGGEGVNTLPYVHTYAGKHIPLKTCNLFP